MSDSILDRYPIAGSRLIEAWKKDNEQQDGYRTYEVYAVRNDLRLEGFGQQTLNKLTTAACEYVWTDNTQT